jgi:hypothetical protein
MEKKEILLPNKRYAKANEEELNLSLNLETTESLIRVGERDIILDAAQIFDDERNASNQYKIYGKLKMIFRNMYSGTTSYNYLQERLYLNGDGSNSDFSGYLPYNEFAFLRKDFYKETPLIQSGSVLGADNNIEFKYSGSREHTTITSVNAPYHNWNIYLTYVSNSDKEYPMKYTLSGNTIYNFLSGDGIPFRVENNGNSYTLTSPIPHGISESEFIIISGISYYVNSVGNGIYDSNKYVVNILKTQFENGTTISGVIFGKRCLDGNDIENSTSEYYVHKHKTLTNVDDYIMDNIGFENNIFEDEKKILLENSKGVNDVIVERNRMETLIYDFKNPFILSGITTNLGFTPTDVYVTVLFRNGNGFFNYPPKNGYKFNFHDTWVDNHFEGDTTKENTISGDTFTISGYTFISGTTLPIGTLLTGAFVEYNKKELKERIISESFHKITNNTDVFDHKQNDSTYYSGVTDNNMVGLYYQPHNRVKLRQVSPYLEQSKTNDIFNLPDVTIYDENEEVWKWRDIYSHGFIDSDGFGTNYPYVNNIHYVKTDVNFYLRNESYYNNKQNKLAKFNINNNKFKC